MVENMLDQFWGDEHFMYHPVPLCLVLLSHSSLMQPYHRQKRIFNCRLTRASMVVEITLLLWPSCGEYFIAKSTCTLKLWTHLWWLHASFTTSCLPLAKTRGCWMRENSWMNHMATVRNMGRNMASREACNVREVVCTVFNSSDGSVSWQHRMVPWPKRL